MNANHAFYLHNRKYYFNAIESTLEPIYYDGGSKILSVLNYSHQDGSYKENLYNYLKVKKINLNKIDQPLFNELMLNNPDKTKKYIPLKGYKRYLVTNSSRKGAQNIISKIENLSKKDFLKKLHKKGFDKISLPQLESVFDTILERLKLINSSEYNDEN